MWCPYGCSCLSVFEGYQWCWCNRLCWKKGHVTLSTFSSQYSSYRASFFIVLTDAQRDFLAGRMWSYSIWPNLCVCAQLIWTLKGGWLWQAVPCLLMFFNLWPGFHQTWGQIVSHLLLPFESKDGIRKYCDHKLCLGLMLELYNAWPVF